MTDAEIEARWGQRLGELVRQFQEQGLTKTQCARALGVREDRIPNGYRMHNLFVEVFMLGGIAVKRCTCCTTARALSDFRDMAERVDGMDSFCRQCRLAGRRINSRGEKANV